MKMKFNLESCRNVVNELQRVIDGSLNLLTLTKVGSGTMFIKLSKNKKKLIVKIKKECEYCEEDGSGETDFIKDFKEIIRNGVKDISPEEADEIADDLQGFLEETYKGRLKDKEIRKTIENEKVFDNRLTDEEVKILSNGFKSIGLEDNDKIMSIIDSMCKSTPKFIIDSMIERVRNGDKKILKIYIALADAAERSIKQRKIEADIEEALDTFFRPLEKNPIAYLIQYTKANRDQYNYPIYHALKKLTKKLDLDELTVRRLNEFINGYRDFMVQRLYKTYIVDMAKSIGCIYPMPDENGNVDIEAMYDLYNLLLAVSKRNENIARINQNMINYVNEISIPVVYKTIKTLIE